MIKIAIVGPDDNMFDECKNYLDSYAEERGESFFITRFLDGDEISYDYEPVYDVIFLSGRMKRLNGVETAEMIRKLDKNVEIVFCASNAVLAIKGYSVGAADFLIRPIEYAVFKPAMDRLYEKIRNKHGSFLLIQTESGYAKVSDRDIVYLESQSHKIIVHTKEQDYFLTSTLKEMKSKLGKNFVRCNHCYIVNLLWVSKVSDNYVIAGKHKLQISRPKKKSFIDALKSFFTVSEAAESD